MNELGPTKTRDSKDGYSEEQLKELALSVVDPLFFIERFIRVQHPTKGALPFKLYDYQRRMVEAYHTHRFTITLTARQAGKTSVAAAYLLWRAMFVPDTTILIVANKFAQALEIMDRVRYAYEQLPNYIRDGTIDYNKSQLTFANHSKIVARATTRDAGRGLSISLLYVDEFAFVPPNIADDFWKAVQPVLSTGGDAIITSTPNQDDDLFAQVWRGAEDNTDEYGNPNESGIGINGYFPIKVLWDEHPDRDEEWEKTTRAQLGEAKFRQEMCCEFVTSDETLINPLTLVNLRGIDPVGYTGQVRWFCDPEPNKIYMAALDPSLGTGGDYAAIQVFMLPDMVQIAEWRHNLSTPREQVRVLMQILLFLNQMLREDYDQRGEPELYWTVENNTLGEAVLQIIEDTGEEKIPGMFVHERRRKGQARRFRKGMNTDNRKKLSACARLKSMVESGRISLSSKLLVRELKNFVSAGAGFKGKSGEHDDLVAACLLIMRMLDVVLFWGNNADNEALRETIAPEDIDTEPMPVIIG